MIENFTTDCVYSDLPTPDEEFQPWLKEKLEDRKRELETGAEAPFSI